ncbi:MFS transporter [Spirillospora sp. CA-142024]|uniref:MFS transporter n=1 Tax=Spirillospora sp. CA-142024 TaxID=3240036 RepID=UPI003D8A0778
MTVVDHSRASLSPVRLRWVLAILSTASFMAALDLFIVNVAFSDIGRDFGAQASDVSWVLNGYAIVFAALLVPLGRLADRYGRRTGFVAGILLFTAASQACAASTSLWMLVVARAFQAVGAAALIPTSLGLLLMVFPPERRTAAVRIWSASSALAAAAGPVLGGFLVNASWRWVFEINIPVGIAAAVAAVRLVPDPRDGAGTRIPDLFGAGLLGTAIGLLSLGLVKLNDWPVPRTAALVLAAVLLLAWFWFRSRRHPSPVIEPRLLGVRVFAWSNVTMLLFSIAFAANLLLTIMWLQGTWRYSAVRTGFAIAPGALMVPVTAVVAGRLQGRVAAGVITAAGCALCALGALVTVLRVGESPGYATEILPAWLIGGAGTGLALPTILSAASEGLPPHRFATGSAVVNMSRQIGSVLGVSLLVAVLGTPIGYAATHRAFMNVWLLVAGFLLAGAVTALWMREREAGTALSDPPA